MIIAETRTITHTKKKKKEREKKQSRKKDKYTKASTEQNLSFLSQTELKFIKKCI
jgi:hypothetical protein